MCVLCLYFMFICVAVDLYMCLFVVCLFNVICLVIY